MNDAKFIIASCCGGLCNKLITLVVSIYISRKSNRELLIIWQNSYSSCCDFNNLFKTNVFNVLQTNDTSLVEFSHQNSVEIPIDEGNKLEDIKYNINYFFDFFKLDKNNFSEDYISLLSDELSNWNNIFTYQHHQPSTIDRNILTRDGYSWNIDEEHILDNKCPIIKYTDNLIPTFMDLAEFGKIAKELESYFCENITQQINNVLLDKKINKDVLSIHERRTDFVFHDAHKRELDEKLICKINNIIANNKDQKIYIACDDNEVKINVGKLYPNNIICMNNNSNPFFKDNYNKYSGHDDLCNNQGMWRLEDFVIKGLVELYVLSYTNLKIENCSSKIDTYFGVASTYALYAYSMCQI